MMEFMQYENITDVIEDDLDCLSLEALFAELLIEEEMGATT
jgi:hypothetical protein